MKARVIVDVDPIHVDEVIESATEEGIFREFRRRLERRLPWLLRTAMRGWTDPRLCQEIGRMHNKQCGSLDAPPATIEQFLVFAEREGYLLWMER